ncbi:MAG TPA: hypothetical protein VFG19_12575 [Geobacteraceae bacterium]|nr:hypothetical protein [Geobacteraceae bacterium]
MKIYVCIDDTDNIESRGTGELASMLARDVETKGWGLSSFVTRHQLLVHPEIPYTSHNSSMCFAADIDETCLSPLISHACLFLERESAEGSDPGLCVAVEERLGNREALLDFGRKAKQLVVAQNEAYALAERLSIHLSAHGGTGHGVIGALAGVGLRLGGNDGRMKGGLKIGEVDSVSRVCEICAHPEVDVVRSMDGKALKGEELVIMGDKAKTVLLDGKSVLLVVPAEGKADAAPWRTCPRQLLKSY